jgi:hypothetical protein
MVEASQIRDVLASYFEHLDGDKFVIEFVKLSYNIHKFGTPEAISLANEVEFRLADVACGCVTKPEFIASLKVLQGSFNV